MLKQWLAICLGRLWRKCDDARWRGVRDSAHEKLYNLLWDEVPDVRMGRGRGGREERRRREGWLGERRRREGWLGERRRREEKEGRLEGRRGEGGKGEFSEGRSEGWRSGGEEGCVAQCYM